MAQVLGKEEYIPKEKCFSEDANTGGLESKNPADDQ